MLKQKTATTETWLKMCFKSSYQTFIGKEGHSKFNMEVLSAIKDKNDKKAKEDAEAAARTAAVQATWAGRIFG